MTIVTKSIIIIMSHYMGHVDHGFQFAKSKKIITTGVYRSFDKVVAPLSLHQAWKPLGGGHLTPKLHGLNDSPPIRIYENCQTTISWVL